MRKIINLGRNKKRILTITIAALTVMLAASVATIGAAPLSVQQQGTGQAPPGQRVTSSNIVDGEVKSADIGDGEVTTDDLADDAVTSGKIANGAVASEDIEDGTITSTDIAEGTIPPAGGGTPDDNSVTSATIVDETIASEDIGEGQVTNSELANDAVTRGNIVDGEVKSADIGDGEVGSADVADGSIGSADLAPDAIPPPTGGGTPDDNSVTSAKIVDGAVASADIGDGQITTHDLANGAVTRDKIAAGAIQLTTQGVSRSVPVLPFGQASGVVVCPSGTTLLSGGFTIVDGRLVDVWQSWPNGNGWGVSLFNPNGFEVTLVIHAHCANPLT